MTVVDSPRKISKMCTCAFIVSIIKKVLQNELRKSRYIVELSTIFISYHDVYNARMAQTHLATANYVWPAAVDTLPLVKT